MSTTYVDWEFAKTTGRTLVAAGPSVSADEAAAEVGAIREAARRAHGPVAETSRLQTPDDAPDALIVDRPTWIAMNADSMGAMLGPAFEQIMTKRGTAAAPNGIAASIGGKVTGAEAGALLAFMSSKVLGQYDLAPGGTPALLLVAPNLLQVQRELGVDPEDFRAWVCMHEETHRVQFTAVPWLRDHMITEARQLATDMAPDQERVQELTKRITEKLPELFSSGSGGITDLVTTPEQRAKLAELTAVMSLLEGHADVVMDDVGPAHIPTVAEIRAKFTERRKGAGAVDKVLRRLLGLEAKMRQYKDGAAFVRGVQERVGVEGFNAVWTSPETLPKPLEITDPAAWVTRVHG
ncbi:coenzyme F420 biosynthesis-associated protein [Knoellia sinensis KCTC 19936]|uniref:Coenzyme F420 biosynthesis-associated protein n=1 Tax=Knoellia sinensis KCTC 19936 TaxID=1385520 RepID=A0A0A0J7P6_9MICO|nr:zinc-dependent metalloprotease [Knoellia sinensis]KGN32047.1 coenzyme F420 biosynthesis-associated protein [Knoellia sinensis KCTC 19936]